MKSSLSLYELAITVQNLGENGQFLRKLEPFREMKLQNSIHYWHYIALATLINASNNICLTLASLRGGHNDPPWKKSP